MPVEVIDESGGQAADSLVAQIHAAAGVILGALGHRDKELGVSLVDDARIRALNRQWRAKDAATDVLSFSQLEGESVAGPMLGDVVISLETMRRQAGAGGWSEAEETVRLLLHGVLHLAGHDHERDSDAAAMRAEERRVIALLAARGIACAADEDVA
ncbi:MAG TPA: rRNA maturation RNase YbeY [Candidatus Binatia bacterium]|jgi:probable rRNA maturation factor